MIKLSIAVPYLRYIELTGRHLPDTEIAEAVGISRHYVKNLREGNVRRKIDLDKLQAILDYFRSLGVNVQLSDLIKEEGE